LHGLAVIYEAFGRRRSYIYRILEQYRYAAATNRPLEIGTLILHMHGGVKYIVFIPIRCEQFESKQCEPRGVGNVANVR
jgi:hypothetical protein